MADTRRLPGPNADVWDWQLEGSCRGMDSAFFFHPDGERGPARARREARAKAVCQSCPVLQMCRAHALAVHEPYGIWGGLSESERETIIKSRKKKERALALAASS
ncbi:WhiB family transcriptional regulator [Thermocrispum municipale]|uniref:WhiB family transcriptional regulator n=1 Tax=Thermocrispum municipale TaxID=37926 RepID=UPI0005B773FF|nr:WhiB family transcriptional regulator [Thermocrispum municipale]